VRAGNGKNVLIYLMRVGRTFESQYKLWQYLREGVREAKVADANPLGDIYRPLGRDTQQDPFNICRYHQPHQSHGHKHNWSADINYQRNNNCRRAALLVGDGDHSFVWDQRMIVFDRQIGRPTLRLNLGEFLGHLQEAD